jgi:hypothetical protein
MRPAIVSNCDLVQDCTTAMKFAFACGPASSGFLFRTVRAVSHFDELIVVVVSFVELSVLLAPHAADVSEKRTTKTAAVIVFRFIKSA